MAMKDKIRGPKDIFGSHDVVQPDLPRRLFFLNTAPVQHTGKQNAEISAPANAKPTITRTTVTMLRLTRIRRHFAVYFQTQL